MTAHTRRIGLIVLFSLATCVSRVDAGAGGEPYGYILAAGGGFISAGKGDRVPFTKSGVGLAGEAWYAPVRWGAAGARAALYRADFDRDALHDRIKGVDDAKLSTSPYTISELGFLVRLEPASLGGWRPFLDAGISGVQWAEQYSCHDITPGPWFPSGTLIDVDRTISAMGWATGGGIRYENLTGIGFSLEAQELFAHGDEVDGRWFRLHALVGWRF